jgi:hypothetical protein
MLRVAAGRSPHRGETVLATTSGIAAGRVALLLRLLLGALFIAHL